MPLTSDADQRLNIDIPLESEPEIAIYASLLKVLAEIARESYEPVGTYDDLVSHAPHH